MKEATRDDAALVAHLLDVNKESVWEIIRGMEFNSPTELAMAVHRAFQSPPQDGTQRPSDARAPVPQIPQVLTRV